MTNDAQVQTFAPQSRKPHYLNPNADLPTIYANNVDIAVSNWDLRLRFGLVEGLTENGELEIRNVQTVYMSVDHARTFLSKAQQALAAFDRMMAAQTTDTSPNAP